MCYFDPMKILPRNNNYAHILPYFLGGVCTANVYTQTTDLLLFSDVVITHENV